MTGPLQAHLGDPVKVIDSIPERNGPTRSVTMPFNFNANHEVSSHVSAITRPSSIKRQHTLDLKTTSPNREPQLDSQLVKEVSDQDQEDLKPLRTRASSEGDLLQSVDDANGSGRRRRPPRRRRRLLRQGEFDTFDHLHTGMFAKSI